MTLPNSCAECEHKHFTGIYWECGMESDDMSSVDIGNPPFNFIPQWCILRTQDNK